MSEARELGIQIALKILENSEWFSAQQQEAGQSHPDWHAGWSKTPKIQLDGRFSREELIAILYFHPS